MQRACQTGAQRGLHRLQRMAGDQVAGQAMGLQRALFVVGSRHFGFVGGNPQGAARAPSAVAVQQRCPFMPALQRKMAQGQFGRAVVHDHQVPHASGGGTPTAVVQHPHVQASLGQVMRAGGTHNTRANDDHIGITAHRRMPQAKGSSASISSVASALMWARPRSVGMMCSPSNS